MPSDQVLLGPLPCDQPQPPTPATGPRLRQPSQATHQTLGGAGQRGWQPLHFRDISIIHDIEVTLPNHHLRDPRAPRVREEPPSLPWSKWAGPGQDSGPRPTPQPDSGTCPSAPDSRLCPRGPSCRTGPGPRPVERGHRAEASASTPPSQGAPAAHTPTAPSECWGPGHRFSVPFLCLSPLPTRTRAPAGSGWARRAVQGRQHTDSGPDHQREDPHSNPGSGLRAMRPSTKGRDILAPPRSGCPAPRGLPDARLRARPQAQVPTMGQTGHQGLAVWAAGTRASAHRVTKEDRCPHTCPLQPWNGDAPAPGIAHGQAGSRGRRLKLRPLPLGGGDGGLPPGLPLGQRQSPGHTARPTRPAARA